jgi:hypothetical protein
VSFITETGVVQASLRQVILLRAGGRIRKAGAVLQRKKTAKWLLEMQACSLVLGFLLLCMGALAQLRADPVV